MYTTVQSFVQAPSTTDYHELYQTTKTLLFDLLDSPCSIHTTYWRYKAFQLCHRTYFRYFGWCK
ncbi:Uncharacterised protein [Staphylococcus devriesei]|nr:Uncharacterised protein [Staphylococcus devriesei]